MRKILILLLFISFSHSYAQVTEIAVKNASGDLVGITTKENFLEQPYYTWFSVNYDSYKLDASTISKLKKALKDVKIKAFTATWCETSRKEIPQLYKLLDAVDFDYKNLEMITVNRGKRTLQNLQDGFNATKVPTFIFYKYDKKTAKDIEIGRYVEFARETLEKDILHIVTKK